MKDLKGYGLISDDRYNSINGTLDTMKNNSSNLGDSLQDVSSDLSSLSGSLNNFLGTTSDVLDNLDDICDVGSGTGLHCRGQKADRACQHHTRPRQPAADRDSGTDRVAQPADLNHLVLHRQGHRADRHHHQNAHRLLPAARHGQQHTAFGSQRRGCQHTDHARRPARCA